MNRSTAAGLLGLLLTMAIGCEDWPLYLHEDPGEDPDAITQRLVIFEDETLDRESIQDLGSVESGTAVEFYGFAHSCGVDEASPWPEWPLHDYDDDGDGIPDSQIPYHFGWYSGDVDWVGFQVAEDLSLLGLLEWTTSPAGEANCSEEDDLDCDWDADCDLDMVVFVDTGSELTLINESGVSHAYPESLASHSTFTGGTQVAIAVGCDHNVPSDYDLRLEIH